MIHFFVCDFIIQPDWQHTLVIMFGQDQQQQQKKNMSFQVVLFSIFKKFSFFWSTVNYFRFLFCHFFSLGTTTSKFIQMIWVWYPQNTVQGCFAAFQLTTRQYFWQIKNNKRQVNLMNEKWFESSTVLKISLKVVFAKKKRKKR